MHHPQSRLIAYRGLWDRFAPPESDAAVKRSFIRGISCVVHPKTTAALNNTLNRLKRELFGTSFYRIPLVVFEKEVRFDHESSMSLIPQAGLWIVEYQQHRVFPVWWLKPDGKKMRVGKYIPLNTMIDLFFKRSEELVQHDLSGDLLFYESLTVLQNLENIRRYGKLSDELLFDQLPPFAMEKKRYCITDLAEECLLSQQPKGDGCPLN